MLLGGFFIIGTPIVLKNVDGIVIAMAGVVWYGLIKNAEKEQKQKGAARGESAAELLARAEEGGRK